MNWEKLPIVFLSVLFHSMGVTIWIEKNSATCACLFDSIQKGWFLELRKTLHRETVCLIQFNRDDYLNVEKLPIVCLFVWFHWMGMIVWIEKNSPSCACLFDSIGWGWLFELRKTPHRVHVCLIQFNGDD